MDMHSSPCRAEPVEMTYQRKHVVVDDAGRV